MCINMIFARKYICIYILQEEKKLKPRWRLHCCMKPWSGPVGGTLCVSGQRAKMLRKKKKVRPGWSMVWHTQKKNATQGTRLPINIQETSVKALTSILHRQPQDCQTHLKIRATFSSFIDVPSTSLSTFSIHFLEEASKIPTKILLSTGSQGELSTGIYEHLFY